MFRKILIANPGVIARCVMRVAAVLCAKLGLRPMRDVELMRLEKTCC